MISGTGGGPPNRARRRLAGIALVLVLGGGYALYALSPLPQWVMGRLARPPGRFCTLDRVLDGDSLRLLCHGERVEVRLYCIDAPEHDQAPWGRQSSRHLREITPRQVELVAVDTDRFGRTVGEVYTAGADRRRLNLEQVAAGQAAVYTHYCTDPDYLRAQQQARAERLGIWSRPGLQQTPWVFRHHGGR